MHTKHYGDETLSAYLDRDLEATEARIVAEHLERCRGCREALEQLVLIRDTAADFEQLEPSEHTWHAIRRRVHRESRPRSGWIWIGAAAAAVAAVLLVFVFPGRSPGGDRRSPEQWIASAPQTRSDARAELSSEYRKYLSGIEDAINEIETAMAENPHNPRVRFAYLTARSNRVQALDRFCSGGY